MLAGVPFVMSPPTRVAVLGSCVSRDAFNSRFSPTYKDLYDCVALSNQVSFLSLMDRPVDLTAEQIGDLDAYSQREVLKETSRGFLHELVEQRPEYVIIDLFADVHFGCVVWDERYLTRNRWKIMKSAVYQQAVKAGQVRDVTPTADPKTYRRLWLAAVDDFFAFLDRELPQTKVILHRARNVTRARSADGTVRNHGNRADLTRMNDWWDQLDDELQRRHVDRVIDVFTEELTSHDGHPWGAFAVHYTDDYHAAFLSNLGQIVVSDLRAAAGISVATAAAPSAPDAGRASPSGGRLAGLRALASRR